jgi:Holin family.
MKIITEMPRILTSICKMFEGFSMGTTAGKILIGAGTFLAAFYCPIVPLLVTCFIFTAVDMFYGIKVAIKCHKKIESHKSWSGTLIKLLDEMVIISLARLLEVAVMGLSQGVFVLTGGSTIIIALTELWSILENLNTLNPKGPWKALGKFLKKKGEDYIGIEIDINDEHTSNTKVDSSES